MVFLKSSKLGKGFFARNGTEYKVGFKGKIKRKVLERGYKPAKILPKAFGQITFPP